MKSSVIRFASVISLFFLLTIIITACDPVPGKELNQSQKIEDMMWLVSRFEEYYAPRDYKEKLYSFNFRELKRKYFALTRETQNNEEYYALMNQFVAEFRDAHTSLSLSAGSLPGRARIAYLGITGERKGSGVIITDLLPNVKSEDMPLHKGDIVTHVNGKPVFDYIDEALVPYRNLGNKESNYTALAGSIFTRMSLKQPIPTDKDISLTVVTSKGASSVISLPWIVQDLFDLKKELAVLKASVKSKKSTFWMPMNFNGSSTEIALLDQNGQPLTTEDLEFIASGSKDFDASYKFQIISGWTTDKVSVKKKEKLKGFEKLKAERDIPENALAMTEAENYPAYVKSQDAPGGGKELVGYIRIDDFSKDESSVSELESTLVKFQSLGVKNLVIDTMNNPGGSLTLVLRVAQAFSNKRLTMPLQQFGLSEWWLDNLQSDALTSTGPKKELMTRLYNNLLSEFKEGKRLSKSYPLDDIIPYGLQPNLKLKTDFNMVVLVNEMNASCGDIFPQIMQENKIAIIMGKKTMGAGGNVASFFQAPHSHADVRQTLSLIVKKDGTYLENNGVTPDIEIGATPKGRVKITLKGSDKNNSEIDDAFSFFEKRENKKSVGCGNILRRLAK